MTDPTPAPAAQPAPAAPLSEADDKLWASLAHLGGIISFLPSLIIWLVLKDRGPKTNVEAKEALNFQITLAIGYVVGIILTLVFVGIILIWAIGIVSIIFSILGFVKVNGGGSYRYPFAIRFIK
jgi:uncharacterized Tic20 family protein